jgi:hypothetical protein
MLAGAGNAGYSPIFSPESRSDVFAIVVGFVR